MTAPVKGSIVFLGSGIGGLPYLEYARSLLPARPMHYLADDAGFPYGTKTPPQIEDLLLERTRRLKARLLPAILVVACDTASQVGLASLRHAHPDLPIVGTVPAIKPAVASTKSGKVGVITTERAVVDPYLDDLIVRYASEIEVMKLAAQGLVAFVENRFLDSGPAERAAAVMPYVRAFIEAGVDRIVLACAHFLYLEKDFLACCEALGATDVQIIDSRQGVANRLAGLVKGMDADLDAENPGGRSAASRLLLTGEPPFGPGYGLWAEHFGLLAPERL
jgi:glutamate racemase